METTNSRIYEHTWENPHTREIKTERVLLKKSTIHWTNDDGITKAMNIVSLEPAPPLTFSEKISNWWKKVTHPSTLLHPVQTNLLEQLALLENDINVNTTNNKEFPLRRSFVNANLNITTTKTGTLTEKSKLLINS